MQLARAYGPTGLTLADVARALGNDRSSVSGRLSELLKLGRLVRLRDGDGRLVRREGCSVLIAAE